MKLITKRRKVFLGVCLGFVLWNVFSYLVIVSRPSEDPSNNAAIYSRLEKLQLELQAQVKSNDDLLNQLKKYKDIVANHKSIEKSDVDTEANAEVIPVPATAKTQDVSPDIIDPKTATIPVMVVACNRATAIKRSLDALIKFRPSKERFPIVVSQDCGHADTAKMIQSFGNQITHIRQPDLSKIELPYNQRKYTDYYKIARHYKWALNQIFHNLNYTDVIIVEDDLDISSDFFDYFAATYPILRKDPTLWCVSAWNDNGKDGMISSQPELLYRTDFFPGLGWMMTKSLWLELEPKWPKTFWDDWMRHPNQRKDRACIRPEISRTSTFGKIGVSKGQHFEKHLKFIHKNDKHVPFTDMDLSFLSKEKYDPQFVNEVYSSPLLPHSSVINNKWPHDVKSVRVEYTKKDQFKSMAKELKLMDDLKSGVPRTGYRGVVSFMRNGMRVYLAPPPSWSGYDVTWN